MAFNFDFGNPDGESDEKYQQYWNRQTRMLNIEAAPTGNNAPIDGTAYMAYLYGSDFIDQTNGAFDAQAANHQPSSDSQPPWSQHAHPVPSMPSSTSVPNSSVLLPQRGITPAVSQRQQLGASQIPNSQHPHRSTSNSAMPTPRQTPALGFRHLSSTPSAQTLDEFQYQNDMAFDNISNGTAFSTPYFVQRDDGVQSGAGAQQYGTMTSSHPVTHASNTFHQAASMTNAPSRLTTPAYFGSNQAFQGGSQYQDNFKRAPSAARSTHTPSTDATALDSQEENGGPPPQITDSELEHASVEDARAYIAHAGDYQPLEIIDDDWKAVRRIHFKYLCAQLFNSLCQPAETDLPGFNNEERAYAERVNVLKAVLKEMDTPEKISMAKARVMLAVDEAIRLHGIGVPPRIPGQKGPKERKNVPIDKKAKCSDRILRMIECVRQNKYAAMDVLRGTTTALAMYPEKYTDAKMKYLRTNATKSVRMQGTGKRAAQGEGEGEDYDRTPIPSVNGRGKSESRQASTVPDDVMSDQQLFSPTMLGYMPAQNPTALKRGQSPVDDLTPEGAVHGNGKRAKQNGGAYMSAGLSGYGTW